MAGRQCVGQMKQERRQNEWHNRVERLQKPDGLSEARDFSHGFFTDKTANTEMMNILEHSIVVLSCKDEMRLFLSERPQSWCDYIETMEEMAEDKGEKEYWKALQSMIR